MNRFFRLLSNIFFLCIVTGAAAMQACEPSSCAMNDDDYVAMEADDEGSSDAMAEETPAAEQVEKAAEKFVTIFNKGQLLYKDLKFLIAGYSFYLPKNGSNAHQLLTEVKELYRQLTEEYDKFDELYQHAPSRNDDKEKIDTFVRAIKECAVHANYFVQKLTRHFEDIQLANREQLIRLFHEAELSHDRRHALIANSGLVFDLLLITIGARGYPHQEIPAFLRNINPAIRVGIIGMSLEWKRQPWLLSQDCQVQTVDLSYIPVPKKQAIASTGRKPFTLLQEANEPVRIFSQATKPSITLIDVPLHVAVAEGDHEYKTSERALDLLINRALTARKTVLIANNTQMFSLEFIPLLAKLYKQYANQNGCQQRIGCYTQGSKGQCIVLDPAKLGWQGQTEADPNGDFLLPGQPGVPVAAFSYNSFYDGSFAFHVQKNNDGTMITGLSGSVEKPKRISDAE